MHIVYIEGLAPGGQAGAVLCLCVVPMSAWLPSRYSGLLPCRKTCVWGTGELATQS